MNKTYKISKRTFSLSHHRPTPTYGPGEIIRSVLLNGIAVASAKPYGGNVGICTIMYQAGSRHEIDDSIGACHFLRAASCASSCAFSGFTKMRYMAQKGASVTCTTDRQTITYTLRSPIDYFSEMKCYLLDIVLRCCYKQWEIDDLKPMLKDDLHRIHPVQRVIDLAQKACWSGPLSNSLFCVKPRIDDMTGEVLNRYTNVNFKADHCSIASVGVPYDETIKLAEALEPRRVKPPPRVLRSSRPRAGFELYDLGPNSDTWICVGVPGCGTCDLANVLKHSIIAHACGSDNMQEGSHSLDRNPELPIGLMSANNLFTTFKTFSISYFDTGFFGIVAKTPANTAWAVAKAATQFLSNVGELDNNQIEIGKKRLKVSLAIHDDDCVKLCEGLALQAVNGYSVDNAHAALNMVDCISNQDIKITALALGEKITQMAYAVVGDITQVPNDTDLRPS